MAKTVSPDKGKEIGWYRDEKLSVDWQRECLDRFDGLVREMCPDVRASIKWSQPVWETKEGPMCFFRGASKHVTFGFWRGAEMEDPSGLLEGEGDRMKHLKIKSAEAMDADLIRGYLRQAIDLNARKGDPTKGN